jgi:hypothetical protein
MSSANRNQRILLDRRLCIVQPGRIYIRPSRGAIIGPLLGLSASGGSFVILAFLMPELPTALLALILVPGLIVCPLSAMGLVYSLFGTQVIIDVRKESALFQQGLLGLGLGTMELVPFWKIDHIAIDEIELGEAEMRAVPPPVDFRAFDIVLAKNGGRRLSLGRTLAANDEELVAEAFQRALAAAEAAADLVGRPLRINVELEEGEGVEAQGRGQGTGQP